RVAANGAAVGTAVKPRGVVVVCSRQSRRLIGQELAADVTQGGEVCRISGRNGKQLAVALRQVDRERARGIRLAAAITRQGGGQGSLRRRARDRSGIGVGTPVAGDPDLSPAPVGAT